MAVRKKTSTTNLPQSLLDQIAESSAVNTHVQDRRRHHLTSRKEARRQGRTAQKQRKAEYFSHTPNTRKRPAEEPHTESPQRKKPRQSNPESAPEAKRYVAPQQQKDKEAPPINSAHSTSKSSENPSKSPSKNSAVRKPSKSSSALKPRPPREDPEDAYISYLEAQLGLSKGGKKKAKEDDDGLDDLMDWADSLLLSKSKNHVAAGDEDESSSEGSLDDSQSVASEQYGSEDEWNGITQEEPVISSHKEMTEEAEMPISQPTGAYIPPHLRKVQESNSEAIQKLTRQLKGLLNRMSEQNIGSIVDSFEEIYREHRRNDVTTTLTTLVISGISDHSSLLDSYVVLYAAFVGALHKLIGIEFAAHFVQTLVSSYEKFYASFQDPLEAKLEQDGKECSNLLVMISELYNFQVISCVLVFDVIRHLLEGDLTEFKVELLLKIMRNSGQQLRQDDPSALKDVIQLVQNKVSTEHDAVSSRTRFMIETLTNLKNNKLKRNTTQNQGGAAVERMKKFLAGLTKSRHVLAHEPLRVSLEDLHSAETKGKWWLVGAAWHGDPLIDKQAEFSKSTGTVQHPDDQPNESADLAKLARSQGMNTEIRRGIFVVLMSSDDYVDACERLSQLNLTEVQQREIIRVVLHCCGNEQSYNPYYTLVCQQLCRTSHAYKITLQFSLWDFLRDLGEKNVGGAAVVKNVNEDDFDLKVISNTRLQNIAKAYAWWIAKDSVTLAVLKPVDFTTLKPRTQEFLKELFTQIFVNSQRPTPLVTSDLRNIPFTRNRNAIEEIFIKASRVQALAMGLVYFLSQTFKVQSEPEDGLSKFLRWAVNVAKDTLRTGVDLVPSM